MRSNFITQSRDKNQIRANFGYKRIGENSNPYPPPRGNKEHTHNQDVNSFSRVLSTPWLALKERDTYPPVTSYHGVRRSGTPHILIQGTRQVIYSDLSSVLVIESRHGTNWEWTQAHSSVGYEPKTTNLRNERHCEGSTHSCATIFESIRLSQNPRIGETDTSFGCQYHHQVT